MELWIRSQDKELLVKAKGFELQHTRYDNGCQIFAVWQNNYQLVGKYKDKTRALEILDDIQDKIKNILILSIKPLMTYKDQHKLLDLYKQEFNRDFIVETDTVEIKPLNSETVLYEMPKE